MRLFVAGLFALIALSGCTKEPDALRALSTDSVILAFGDSLTFGTGSKPSQSYPAVLERLTGLTVINAGKPGEMSAEGLARLRRVLDRESPDLVVLCHGGNDYLRRLDKHRTEQNLREMITEIRGRDIDVVMLGVPDFGLFLSVAELYTDVAADLKVPIEEDVIPEVLGDNRLKSDQIHPNADGYQRMAEALHELLKESGAL